MIWNRCRTTMFIPIQYPVTLSPFYVRTPPLRPPRPGHEVALHAIQPISNFVVSILIPIAINELIQPLPIWLTGGEEVGYGLMD